MPSFTSNHPWLSIILCVAKTKYLNKCIRSLLKQPEWVEFIVVDDRGTGEPLSLPWEMLQRCLFISCPKNQGATCPAVTWNMGVSHARGEWISVLGDDDWIDQCWSAGIRDLSLRFPSCRVLRSRLTIVNEHDEIHRIGLMMPSHEPWWEFLYARNMHHRAMSLGEHVFHADTLRNNGGFPLLPLAWGSDDLAVLIAALDGGIASTNHVNYYWRVHPESISGGTYCKKKITAMRMLFKKQRDLIMSASRSSWKINLLHAISEREKGLAEQLCQVRWANSPIARLRRIVQFPWTHR